LNAALLSTLDKHAPENTKTRKPNKHIIRNADVINARRQRRRAERKFKKSPSVQNKLELNNTKKFLKFTVNKSRDNFYESKFEQYESDPKQTFRLVNRLLGCDTRKVYPSHEEPASLANDFENYYDEKISTIIQ